jgi:alpha-tubulin suppressor-like RCC1 family protein
LVCDVNGTVFGFGNNQVFLINNTKFGNLGFDSLLNSSIFIPQKIPNLSNIIDIYAGYHNSFALNSSNRAFGFGENQFGLFCLGNSNPSYTPLLIPILNIKQVSNGFSSHVLYLNSSGFILSCGFNGYGELGFNLIKLRNWVLI